MPILLVAYKRLNITELEAENVINEGYSAVDGVAALAGGKKMEDGVVYHFNGMGVSALIPPLADTGMSSAQSPSAVERISMKQRLSSHPEVSSVCYCQHIAEPTRWDANLDDATFPDHFPNGIEWNLAMISANGKVASEYNGTGIKIAVLDTGIERHKDLNVKGGVSFCEGDSAFDTDPHGHGTHCAGIVAGRRIGIAKEADLFSIKVSDKNGASPVAVLAGMGWAFRNRMNVISISLAGPADSTYMIAFANAVQALMSINCLVVASTGDGGGDVGFPANTPGVIAVGGCDLSYSILNGTRLGGKGNHLTVVAPGKNIKTTFHKNDGYVDGFTGSSAAAPHVTGLVALIQEKFPGITALQIISRILASTTPVDIISGNMYQYGCARLIDCDMALSLS